MRGWGVSSYRGSKGLAFCCCHVGQCVYAYGLFVQQMWRKYGGDEGDDLSEEGRPPAPVRDLSRNTDHRASSN